MILNVSVIPEDPLLAQNFKASEGEVGTLDCIVMGGKPLPVFTWSIIGKFN